MTPLNKSDPDKPHSDFEKYFSEMKAMNEHIADMITKMHDKSDNKTENQLHPMSVQIIELSSKYSEKIKTEWLTINSEHPCSTDQFESKSHDNAYPYIQSIEQPEEELIESRKNKKWSQTSSHHDTLNIKCSLSPLKLYILKTALRLNYKQSLINMIKFLNNQKKH